MPQILNLFFTCFLLYFLPTFSFKLTHSAVHRAIKSTKTKSILYSNKRGFSFDDGYTLLMKVIGELINPKISPSIETKENRLLTTGVDMTDPLVNYDKDKIVDIIMLHKLKFSRLDSITRDEFIQYANYLPDFIADLTFDYPVLDKFLQEKYYPIQEKAQEGDKQAAKHLEKMQLKLMDLWGLDLHAFVQVYEDHKIR